MKLAKALKVKNRLAGEIALAQKLIAASNVTEGANTPPHDVHALYEALVRTQAKIADLKGKIAIANGPISEKIFRMAELKARITFLRALPTKDGNFLVEGRYGQESTTREYHATMKAADVENNCAAIQLAIEQLQDELDEYNATTEI